MDELKEQADLLGIKYRSDIKEDTLRKKIEDHNNEDDGEAVKLLEVMNDKTTTMKEFYAAREAYLAL